LASTVAEFLGEHGLARRDVSFWIANPRSPQILDAIGESLDLSQRELEPSWSAWERSGNTISATIFFILEELRRSAPPSDGDLGLMLSFGAGVTCEMVLLRWHEIGSPSA
jgi:alkylresorcinol/alkylpyrone synthase